MISKQLMAFFAGVTMVVACAGAFVLYDQKNGPEIQSDADTTGDGKVSNDPTSGFMSYDGHKYYLHYGSVSGTSTFTTSYTIEFDSTEHGFLTGYVNNIQVNVRGSYTSYIYHPGHNELNCNTNYTDSANSGLALLKQMQFVFSPLKEKADSSLKITVEDVTITYYDTVYNDGDYEKIEKTKTEKHSFLNYSNTFQSGSSATLYYSDNYSYPVSFNESGKTDLGQGACSSSNTYWLVFGDSIYNVPVESA